MHLNTVAMVVREDPHPPHPGQASANDSLKPMLCLLVILIAIAGTVLWRWMRDKGGNRQH